MPTLYEKLAGPYDCDERKHDLRPGLAEREINSLTQFEFLQRLSEALEEAGVMVHDSVAEDE